VTLELLLGVLVGPVVLGWVAVSGLVDAIAEFGLALLLFMAGYEIDFRRIRGAPLGSAVTGWFASLALGLLCGLLLGVVIGGGDALTAQVVGLALTTTALGTILPMIRDAGALPTLFGARILAIGTAGEFGPIVAITFVFSEDAPLHSLALILGFALIAMGAAFAATRPRPPRLAALVTATIGTSAQLAVRIVMLVLVAMLWIAERFSLDVLLGAFTAGIVVRLSMNAADESQERIVAAKMDAIGFGFFIPIFFVVSGARLDVGSMFAEPVSLLLIPVTLVLFLVCRGLPAYLLNRRTGDAPALALFASAALPLVVVITSTGVELGAVKPSTAAAMVTAGVLSVLIYPLAALRQPPRSS
jgi:Kef-type K+ transport system membrane component KefB